MTLSPSVAQNRPGSLPAPLLLFPLLILLLSRPSVMSDSLWLHGLQHTRLPCPSPSPGAGSNSCPSSQWCQSTISSSATPFSSCLQSFPALGAFLMTGLFVSGGQSIRASASASVLPMNIQDWYPLGFTIWSPCSPRDSREYSPTTQFESINSSAPRFFMVQLSHPYMTTGKTIALTRRTSAGKVMFLLFNMLSRLLIAFLPRSKHLLISWLQSPSAVILEPEKRKPFTVSIVSPSICQEVMWQDALILVFWMLFLASFFTLLFHFHQEAL